MISQLENGRKHALTDGLTDLKALQRGLIDGLSDNIMRDNDVKQREKTCTAKRQTNFEIVRLI